MLLGYELVLRTRWFGYELVRVRLGIGIGQGTTLHGYELTGNRITSRSSYEPIVCTIVHTHTQLHTHTHTHIHTHRHISTAIQLVAQCPCALHGQWYAVY